MIKPAAEISSEVGRKLESMRGSLVDAAAARIALPHPEIAAAASSDIERHRDHVATSLTYLAQSLTTSRPVLFQKYVAWAKAMLAGRGVPDTFLARNLSVTAEVIRDRLPPGDALVACRPIEAILTDLPAMDDGVPSCLDREHPFAALAAAYLAALLTCDRREATRLIHDAVEGGAAIRDIYIHVFQRSQHEIGRLWQTNAISVAQEHFCTAATQVIMSQLYPKIFSTPRVGRCFVGTSVAGDLHEVGIRIISDFFEMDGWDTVFLGASTPVPDLVGTIRDHRPDVLGISVTITPQLSAVADTIATVKRTPGCERVKIMVGGYPFVAAPDLWKDMRADGTCPDAQNVVEMANLLLSG